MSEWAVAGGMWRERGESRAWGEGSCSLSGTRTRCGSAAAAQRICQRDPPPGAGAGARWGLCWPRLLDRRRGTGAPSPAVGEPSRLLAQFPRPAAAVFP